MTILLVQRRIKLFWISYWAYKTPVMQVRSILITIALIILFIRLYSQQQLSDSIELTYSIAEVEIVRPSITLQSIELKPFHFLRNAASFDDPTRSLQNYAGFSTANDQANSVIYRGLDASFHKWYVNGGRTVNVNHLSNAGTTSNLSSLGSGGVNMFSGQLLRSMRVSNIEGGDPAAGLNLDLRLRPKLENYTQVSVLGLEGGVTTASTPKFDMWVNGRYSFTGLLSQFGVDFDGESIGFWDLHTGLEYRHQRSKTNLHLSYGQSNNEKDTISPALTLEDLESINYTSNIFIAGVVNNRVLSNNGKLLVGITYSNRSDLSDRMLIEIADGNQDHNILHTRVGYSKNAWEFGANLILEDYLLSNETFFAGETIVLPELYSNRNSFSISSTYTIKSDRASAKICISPIFFSYAQSSANADVNGYFDLMHVITNSWSGLLRVKRVVDFTPIQFTIHKVNPIKTFMTQLGIAYQGPFKIQVQVFYQHLSDMRDNIAGNSLGLPYYPVFDDSRFPLTAHLSSIGLESTAEYTIGDRWYILLSASAQQNDYETSSDRRFAYDNSYQASAMVQRKWKLSEDRTISISTSLKVREGFIQPEYSLISQEWPLSISPKINARELANYWRIDTRVNYRWRSNFITLDIQNLTNRLNEAFDIFGSDGTIFQETQLGLIPVLSYRRGF